MTELATCYSKHPKTYPYIYMFPCHLNPHEEKKINHYRHISRPREGIPRFDHLLTPAMAFKTSPATSADIQELSIVMYESFIDDPHARAKFDALSQAQVVQCWTPRLTEMFRDVCFRIFKVVEISDGTIVGCSVFRFPLTTGLLVGSQHQGHGLNNENSQHVQGLERHSNLGAKVDVS